MLLCTSVVFGILSVVETRVYCRDSNASPWVPTGFSCPVMCQNIVNAIQRLQMRDIDDIISNTPDITYLKQYEYPQIQQYTDDDILNEVETYHDNDNRFINNAKLLAEERNRKSYDGDRLKDYEIGDEIDGFNSDNSKNKNEYNFIGKADFKDTSIDTSVKFKASDKGKTDLKDPKLYAELDTLDQLKDTREIDDSKMDKTKNFKDNETAIDNQFYKDVIKLTQIATKTFKACKEMKEMTLITKIMKCARKANFDSSFITIMTNLLNKYAKSKYKFTDEMTEILLEKILGTNTDLRNNIFDVKKLLGYLRQALRLHRDHETGDVIWLKPARCLTLSLPGCFCKAGFVESSGQCVKPADCVSEHHYGYLARIVVT